MAETSFLTARQFFALCLVLSLFIVSLIDLISQKEEKLATRIIKSISGHDTKRIFAYLCTRAGVRAIGGGATL